MTLGATPRTWWALATGVMAGCALTLAACAAQLPQGETLMASGRWDEAVAFYLEAVQRNRSDPEARAGLIRALTEAAIHYQRQGEAAVRAGRLDEAKAFFERALSYNSENPTARTELAKITNRAEALQAVKRGREQLEKGDHRGAIREAEAALQLVPDLPEAQALLKEANAALATAKPSEAEGDPLALFPARPVTLRFRDTDIKEVLEVFARVSNVNIFTDDAVGPKRITANFRDLPIREAFRLILAANRFFAKQVAPNTVVVVPDNPGKRQQYEELFVRTFYLTSADAKVAVNLVRTILNTRQIFVNEKLNALVVRDTPEKLELARKLLEANDRGGAEVEFELEVLEVDRTRLQDLGIQFNQQFQATLSIPTNQRIGALQFAGFFRGGTLTVTNPTVTLNLLKNQGSTRTLAHPTIRVLDRSKARLLIGERRPFQISQLSSVPATAGAAGAAPVAPTGAVTTTETRVEFRDVGLKLTLTPTIHLDGEVTIEINFEISTVGAPIPGVTGGALLPPVNTRNLDSFIKVRDGETRVLGGLFQDSDSESIQKIPFLGDLPFVGRLFSNVRTDKARTDVLVAITPRLVKTVERPRPDIERFFSGTAEAFGGGAAAPLPVPAPGPPVRPSPQPAPPGGGPPGAPPFPGAPPPPPGSPPPGAGPVPDTAPAAAAAESAPLPAGDPGEPPQPPLMRASAEARDQGPAPAAQETLPPPPPFTSPAEGEPTAQREPPAAQPAPQGGVSLEVGAFQDVAQAQALVADLRRGGLGAFSVPAEIPRKGRWVRVFVGPFPDERAAAAGMRLLPAGAPVPKTLRLPYALESAPLPSSERAAALVTRAQGLGYTPTVLTGPSGPAGQPQFRVLLEGFPTPEEAQALVQELQAPEAGFRTVAQ